MIELIYHDLCSGCGKCVEVCPTNVLTLNTDSMPNITDPWACQTCFMCELYCTSDALYVAADCDQLRQPDPDTVRASGQLGQYRRDSGWDEWANDPTHRNEHWRMDEVFALARNKMHLQNNKLLK